MSKTFEITEEQANDLVKIHGALNNLEVKGRVNMVNVVNSIDALEKIIVSFGDANPEADVVVRPNKEGGDK